MKKTSENLKVIDKNIKKDISEEKLDTEVEQVAKEILAQQEEAALQSLTNPSAIALSTTKHDSGTGLERVKKNPKQLFILYLTNQFVARAINVRADALISKGYKIVGGDDAGRKACSDLIENSGGENLFWQLSVNSVTKDTPILVKYPDNSIDIVEMSELYKDKEDSANIGRYSTQEIRDLQVMTDEGWQNIKYVFRHKIDEDIYKIRTGTGLAKVTHDHSLMSGGNEIHSKDLKIGTNIDVVNIVDESLVNDHKDIDNDMAWLYGFFVADGTAGIYKTGKQWKITNKNREFLEKAELIIKEKIDKTAKIYWYNDIGHVSFSPSKNEEVFNWFLDNCYTSNRFKRVPKNILNSSLHVIESFMEGYWAGDGAKYTSWKNSRCATDSFSLIAGIEYIVKKLGKSISLNTVSNRENVYLIQIRDGIDDKNCFENIEKMNYVMESEHTNKKALSDEEISILTSIPRRTITYYRSLNDVPSKQYRQIVYDNEDTIFGFFDDNHFDYLTKRKKDGIIEEIRTEKYNDYVYDIATENHRFVAGVGGLLHHNTDISGNGFNEKIYNKNKTSILRLKHVHPLTLSFKTNKETNKIIVDEYGKPVGYVQYHSDVNGQEIESDVPLDRIAHLRFNTLGDEFTGVSTIQPGYDTIVRLMNMEFSAAEAAIKTANPIIVGKCNTKSPHQIAMWGTILGRINGKEQVFVPQDMELEMLSPGPQNFNDYAEYFLTAVVSTFGVPKAMLLGESSGGNRAEAVVLSRHFYSLIRSNQRYMQEYFNKIFEEYAEIAGFQAPKLEFEDVAEDAAVNTKSAIELFNAGIIDNKEARQMIGLEGSIETDLKKSDMETYYPEEPGKPSGSQAGVKNKQKNDEFSEVNPVTTQ